MRVEYEVMKVEETEGVVTVGENDTFSCPMCAGYEFTVAFDAQHHVDLHCIKCQALLHLKTVSL